MIIARKPYNLWIPAMKLGEPSKTALRAATARAAHQVLDRGQIFTDPLAVRILGSESNHPYTRRWRQSAQ